ncbi:hypothetical protein G6N82_10330 [Altererythrobacter sp. BO-6]|uniref:hypothetical protein n=1 Tax=Altererythrobacter sp. BO-6 TaxID=2604537 RepID=UPI0013E17763|nr:hypothetical protein [Altererythrobacter sp. BO-6]QIG54494.1 hypothetical protein G6N82_10330 [Altererythrobacter sp. BO-6]
MNLYEVEIERPHGAARGYIVAPTEERAAELVIDHELDLSLASPAFSLERVDETLAEDWRMDLDSLLENAPVGFASYREPLGWISHVASVQMLKLFRIEDSLGAETFLIAPDRTTALVIYCAEFRLDEGEERQVSVCDGLAGLPADRLRNLPTLLEFGPVGMVDFDEECGWLA